MTDNDQLQGVVQAVLGRAQSQGSVVGRDIREELARAGLPGHRWRDVVALAQPQLSRRRGRYHYLTPLQARMEHDRQVKKKVGRVVTRLMRRYKEVVLAVQDRREHRRIHLIRPVTAYANDQRELHLLSQDISLSGIRLIGNCDLRGQRIRVQIAGFGEGEVGWNFLVQILWSSAAGDGLLESGGIFVGLDE